MRSVRPSCRTVYTCMSTEERNSFAVMITFPGRLPMRCARVRLYCRPVRQHRDLKYCVLAGDRYQVMHMHRTIASLSSTLASYP